MKSLRTFTKYYAVILSGKVIFPAISRVIFFSKKNPEIFRLITRCNQLTLKISTIPKTVNAEQYDLISRDTLHMHTLQVPSLVQQRVKLWMEYTWRQQKSFNENNILDFLPLKMRTDLALQIHYKTLSKVKLFQDCDSGLLKASSIQPTVHHC